MRMHLIGVVFLAGCGTAGAPDPQAPRPVADTIADVLGDREARIGREGDRYEVETKIDLELAIAADGTLLESEVELPIALLPAVIRAAVSEPIGEAALIVTADGVTYELETADRELRIDATGQILGEEQDDDDDDDDEDDDR